MAVFVCDNCGAEFLGWSGKCEICKAWNSLKQIKDTKKRVRRESFKEGYQESSILNNIKEDRLERITTDIGEFDNVLGGGIQGGSVSLITGDPGIGKSTLMLQIAAQVSKTNKVLYVSSEENEQQIKNRSQRLKINSANLYVFCSVFQEDILAQIEKISPILVIIDSIQAISLTQKNFQIGLNSLLRETTFEFTQIAKKKNISTFLVGHITKDGVVAGPRIVEHMVDTVLYFENSKIFRILRATKNRFGSTNEIGIFKMSSKGLKPVGNPSEFFLSGNESTQGLAKGAVMEGSRVFLIEAQALVTSANYGNPQRISIGYEPRRVSMLIAIIEKHLSINLKQKDIFINLAGGMKTTDTSIDLAVVASIISSFKDFSLPSNTIFIGEIDLNGSIRPIINIKKKINEAKKMGYTKVIGSSSQKIKNLIGIKNINQLYKLIFTP